MVDYEIPTNFTTPFFAKGLHLRDSASNVSGDESILPASTLSACTDFDSSSDMMSLLVTARSTSPTSLLEESRFYLSTDHKDPRETVDFEKWKKHDTDLTALGSTNRTSRMNLDNGDSHTPTTFALEQNDARFMPIHAKSVNSQRSRTPSPGMSKMLLSLSDHPVERPCSPNASTLYRNTKTHCNPSELGQQTYNECMMFTRWANTFLQHSQDQFLITDLARDLGDGITLLSLVEMLVGEYPPQIHIKPALDIQKMENIQTCLDFLEHYGVSVNGITADDIVKGNLKVVLALCHSLHRHFGSSAVANPQVYHVVDKDDLSLFSWVSKVTSKQVVDFQSFQDGTVLCLLLNKILDGVIPNLVLEFGSAVEKISLALKVSSEQLSIRTSLQADAIVNQRCREKFVDYLKSLYMVYSNKFKKVHDAFEQRNLRRELKRQQLKEQRLQSEQRGSELTYLGDLSQNKSHIARERLQISLANASKGVPSDENVNNTRRQIDELEPVSVTNASTVIPSSELDQVLRTNASKKMPRNGTLNSTKRQLDELKKELELLKLECSETLDEDGCKSSFTWQDSLSKGNATPGLNVSNVRRKQVNPRLELRDVYRGKPSVNLSQRSQETAHNNDSSVAKTEKTFQTDSDDGKPLFGECYLGKIPISFDKSSRRELDCEEPSFTCKEMDVQPAQSFIHGGTRTFPSYESSQNSKSDIVVGNGLIHLKPYTDTKGISNLFEVDFSDVDVRKSCDRENLALRRMLRAGKSKHDLDTVHSTSHGKTNEVGEAKMSLPSSFTNEDKGKVLDRSVGVVPSRKPMYSEEKVRVRERSSLEALARDSTEQPRQLPRSLSKEKSFREQALAKKSARSVQPSSTKTHLHALTALIRMSAKTAGGMCDEEAQ